MSTSAKSATRQELDRPEALNPKGLTRVPYCLGDPRNDPDLQSKLKQPQNLGFLLSGPTPPQIAEAGMNIPQHLQVLSIHAAIS